MTSWDAAVAAWEAVGRPYPLAYALARATTTAASESHDEAATGLGVHGAAGLAGQLAARPLQQQIGQLPRRARIQLPAPAAAVRVRLRCNSG